MFVRLASLLLFFNDYKLLPLCFTILISTLSVINTVESNLFENIPTSSTLILSKVFLLSIPILFIFVSLLAILGVHNIGAMLLIAFISILFSYTSLIKLNSTITIKREKVQSFIGKNVVLEGVVLSKESASQYLFIVGSNNVGEVLLNVRGYSVIHTGQKCIVMGNLVEPSSFEDFDYKRYLFRKGIYAILNVQEYECQNSGSKLLLLRSKLEKVIERGLPEPESSLLIGILFGSKRVFTKEFSESLRISGLSHIIAASGYNISLLAIGVDKLLGKSRGKNTFLLKIAIIWMFTIFAGFSSSLVRASTMSSIYFLILFLGRDISKAVAIVVCVTLLISLNPFIIYDIGFLLSLFSTVGLIFFPNCFKISSKWVKDSILPTLTCIIFTLPIVVYFFGKISLVSMLSNLLATPIIQSTIYWGLAITSLTLISDIFKILYLIPYLQLTIFKYIVEISSVVPMVEVNFDTKIFVPAIYILLFLFALLKYPISDENYYIKKGKLLVNRGT